MLYTNDVCLCGPLGRIHGTEEDRDHAVPAFRVSPRLPRKGVAHPRGFPLEMPRDASIRT